MTSRTSEIISGSSAEVGSSKSMTLGSIARARAMATRCCCPPDSWAGYFSAWAAHADPVEQLERPLLGLGRLLLAHLDGPQGDVLEDRLVAEQVEALEDHPDLGAQPGQLLALRRERLAVQEDLALVDRSRAG